MHLRAFAQGLLKLQWILYEFENDTLKLSPPISGASL